MNNADFKRRERFERYADISQRMKRLARDLNIPVVLLAQINRETADEYERPKLSHIRDTGSLEQDADIVLLLYVDRDDDSIIRVAIAKGRNAGRTGPNTDLRLRFEAPLMKVYADD